MEFDYYSFSETFVVLTADQFVGRDDGLLEQQKQDESRNCGLCVVYIQREELRYWLVPGSVKNNRIN